MRRGLANIEADSRIESSARTFSATGWRQDFQSVSAQLKLPPGWRLLAASGTDETAGSWFSQWTLLDLFVLLIVAFGCARLWGWPWGLLALCALTLSYQEVDAPRWIWLVVLAACGLLKVLPAVGKAHRGATILRALALLVLVLIMLPFSVAQIRLALHPALEPIEAEPRLGAAMFGRVAPQPEFAAAPAAAPVEAQLIEEVIQPAPAMAPPPPPKSSKFTFSEPNQGLDRRATNFELDRVDPNAIVQTGPGLPRWTWRSHDLTWNGPVDQSATMTLWLLSPAMNALLALLRVVLLGLLLARVLGLSLAWPGWRRATPAALLALALAGTLGAPAPAEAAELPSAELLEEYKKKLTLPAECLPDCADLGRMQIEASGATLQIRLEVHALEQTAVPLPGTAKQWLAQSILVNGQPAAAMLRDAEGKIWLALPAGVHQVLMKGDIGAVENVLLPLPMKPHRVDTKLDGWTLTGLRDNGLADDNLQLARTQTNARGKEAEQEASLPPFVRVTRTLNLGLRWEVTTTVERIAPSDAPIFVEVPLLQGESLTSSEPRVENGKAQVNLGPQASTLSWSSALKEAPLLTLTAAKQSNLIETWQLSASKQWHVELSGIPVVRHQDAAQRWMPNWRPWPGEEVKLKISRPAGVPGQTLTLDASTLTVTPGERASAVKLVLELRASRGALHLVTLPADAVLESVTLNAAVLPIRIERGKLRLPLQPGAQTVAIQWRQPGGMETAFSVPLVDTGLPSVNTNFVVNMPKDRWTVMLDGPRLGPAVLLWGIVLALALFAFGLGRVDATPLKGRHWFLLALGLTQTAAMNAVLIAGWLVVLGYRRRHGARLARGNFNLAQVLLGLWTVAALAGLFVAVSQSLVGFPDMQISGNGSTSATLNWYADRSAGRLEQPWIVSVPLLAYRLLMLVWAIWLAYSLLGWLKWGWACFSENGYWRPAPPRPAPDQAPAQAEAPRASESESAPVP